MRGLSANQRLCPPEACKHGCAGRGARAWRDGIARRLPSAHATQRAQAQAPQACAARKSSDAAAARAAARPPFASVDTLVHTVTPGHAPFFRAPNATCPPSMLSNLTPCASLTHVLLLATPFACAFLFVTRGCSAGAQIRRPTPCRPPSQKSTSASVSLLTSLAWAY